MRPQSRSIGIRTGESVAQCRIAPKQKANPAKKAGLRDLDRWKNAASAVWGRPRLFQRLVTEGVKLIGQDEAASLNVRLVRDVEVITAADFKDGLCIEAREPVFTL